MLILRHVMAGLSLLLAAAGCGNIASEPIPDGLIQVWRNPAPGYQDRYFEVRWDSVLFGLSNSAPKMHPIETVQSEKLGKTTKLEIEYRADDGEPVPLYLEYTPGSPPKLRIGVREDLWIPEKDYQLAEG